MTNNNFFVNQNIVKTPLAKMNIEDVKKVVDFFWNHPHDTLATASEIGVSGSFMTSLVKRGYAKVARKRLGEFYPVGDGLYRRREYNEYYMTCPVEDFWHDYVKSTQLIATNLKDSATGHIYLAREKLSEAAMMLERVEGIVL